MLPATQARYNLASRACPARWVALMEGTQLRAVSVVLGVRVAPAPVRRIELASHWHPVSLSVQVLQLVHSLVGLS